MTTVIQCYPALLSKINSRIIRESEALIDLKLVDKVYVLGFKKLNSEVLSKHKKIYYIGGYKKNKGLNYLFFLFSIVYYSIQLKPTFLTIRRGELILMSILAYFLRFGKLKLIYSPHELESHRAGIPLWHRKLINLSEKIAIRFYSKIIVVCSPIENWYRKRYPFKDVYTLRSIPVNRKINNQNNFNFKKQFGLSSKELLFIYQGGSLALSYLYVLEFEKNIIILSFSLV